MDNLQEVYSFLSAADQDSQGNLRDSSTIVVIVSNTGQQDTLPPGYTSSDVSKRAEEYLSTYRMYTADHTTSLQRLSYSELEAIEPDVSSIVYVFDVSVAPLVIYIMSPNKGIYSNGWKLIRFLSHSVWEFVGRHRAIFNPEIILTCGQIRVPLEDFVVAVKSLVQTGEVMEEVAAMGRMDKTNFWRSLVSSGTATGEDYACGRVELSAIDVRQLTPRNTQMYGSETSDCAEEGHHMN